MASACSAHPSSSSVVECDQCARGLCASCESELGTTCAGCHLRNVEVVSGGATTRLICAGIGAFLGFFGGGVIGGAGSTGFDWIERYLIGALIVTGVFGGFVYGWKSVKGLSQGWIMTPAAWLWFFALQLSLAMLIGPFAMPFGIAADIRDLKACSTLREALRS